MTDNDSERLSKQANPFTEENHENGVSSNDSMREDTGYDHPIVTEKKGRTNLFQNLEPDQPYGSVRDVGTQYSERHRVEVAKSILKEKKNDTDSRAQLNHKGASRSVETTMTARRASGKPPVPHTWGRENATPTRFTELADVNRSITLKEIVNKTTTVHDMKMTHDRVREPSRENRSPPLETETKPTENLTPTEEYLRMTERCIEEKTLPPDSLKTLRDLYASYKANMGYGTATNLPGNVRSGTRGPTQSGYARSIDQQDPPRAFETEDARGKIGYSLETDKSLLRRSARTVENLDGGREVSYRPGGRTASVGYDELESFARNRRTSRSTVGNGIPYEGTNAAEEVRFNTNGPRGRSFHEGGIVESELLTTREETQQNDEEELSEDGQPFSDFGNTCDFESLTIENIFSDFSLRGVSYDDVLKKRIAAKIEPRETQRFEGSENIHRSSTSTVITNEISGKREIRLNDDARPYENQETSPRKSGKSISRGITVRSNRQCKCQKYDHK